MKNLPIDKKYLAHLTIWSAGWCNHILCLFVKRSNRTRIRSHESSVADHPKSRLNFKVSRSPNRSKNKSSLVIFALFILWKDSGSKWSQNYNAFWHERKRARTFSTCWTCWKGEICFGASRLCHSTTSPEKARIEGACDKDWCCIFFPPTF